MSVVPDCTAGEYLNSAHGDSFTGVQRPNMTSYSTGNCAHCHEQHASVGGSEPAPNTPAGPDSYLAAANEEDLCFTCHGTTPVGTAPDVATDVTTTSNHGHLAQNYTGIHLPTETLSITKHIECTDCHNPHKAGDTLHSTGSNTITSTGPLNGVTGADTNYEISAPDIWAAPDQTDYTLQNATKEYQVCFKCHSKANSDVITWGDSTPDSEDWTDVGLEFNPYNRSGHPIVRGLSSYPNSIAGNNGVNANKITKGLTVGQMSSPWTNVGTQTMYCSDCHSGDNAAGPHGSAVKWMLAGPRKAWPYLLAENNGANIQDQWTRPYNDTRYYFPKDKFWRLGDVATSPTDTNGLFCLNCHPVADTNKVHGDSHHSTDARCADCHIRVPHGGKVSRLIAAVDAEKFDGTNPGTKYAGGMPARYTATGDGHGSGVTISEDLYSDTDTFVRQFNKCTPTDYEKANCYSTSKYDPDGFSSNPCNDSGAHQAEVEDHSVGSWINPLLTGESW
ncbi:MAG: hypothetical protein OEL66_02145 [Desulfobulbaceae bacterium]|nr:hypothetical protein [Desulfobulbaceae bacterium]